MSYRTVVNDVQIFGNNEYYPEWIEYIRSQGIEIDEDGCYEGEITDVMGAVIAIEKVIQRLEEERRQKIREFKRSLKNVEEKDLPEYVDRPTSLFDFRKNYDDYLDVQERFPDDEYNKSITDRMMDLRKDAYIFMSCLFLDACGDMITRVRHFTVPGHLNCYEIKKGCRIKVHAR